MGLNQQAWRSTQQTSINIETSDSLGVQAGNSQVCSQCAMSFHVLSTCCCISMVVGKLQRCFCTRRWWKVKFKATSMLTRNDGERKMTFPKRPSAFHDFPQFWHADDFPQFRTIDYRCNHIPLLLDIHNIHIILYIDIYLHTSCIHIYYYTYDMHMCIYIYYTYY